MPSRRKRRPPRAALVLGAGGIRGWAHAGVLRVLHEAAVRVDFIVGASAGALIGALYAARRDGEETARIAASFTPADFMQWFLDDLRISPRLGPMSRLLWEAYGRLEFEEMAVPFIVMALDLASGERLPLNSGPVGRAVEASIRPPLLTRPVRRDGKRLIDGGLQNALPVDVALAAPAGRVIAVNVGEAYRLPDRYRPLSASLAERAGRWAGRPDGVPGQVSFLAALLAGGPAKRAPADLEIRPDLTGVNSVWPWHTREAIRRGEIAARGALPQIRRLLEEPVR